MMVHIRFEGRSFDVEKFRLDVSGDHNDCEILQRVARYLEVPVERLQRYVIDRSASGALIVRPEAVYG